jgi:hypothetical protein
MLEINSAILEQERGDKSTWEISGEGVWKGLGSPRKVRAGIGYCVRGERQG